MGLAKEGYTAAQQGTTAVNVGITDAGFIAVAGDTVAGTKKFQINKVAAENDLTDNTEVLNFFITLANGTGDSLSNTMQVKWGV